MVPEQYNGSVGSLEQSKIFARVHNFVKTHEALDPVCCKNLLATFPAHSNPLLILSSFLKHSIMSSKNPPSIWLGVYYDIMVGFALVVAANWRGGIRYCRMKVGS